MTMKKDKQRGQALIMTTLLLIPMLGMLGMVTDLGIHALYQDDRTVSR
jgi:Flp pilus assembly protein TadG